MDSRNLLKKPKITKRFAKEDGKAEGEKNNLPRLADRRSSLPRDELRSTDTQKSISGLRRRTYRSKPVDKSRESLEAEESVHGLSTRTPATVSITGLSASPAEKLLLQSMSSDNEDLSYENKVAKNNNNKTSERREIRENETYVKNETGKDKDFKNENTEASESPLKANTTTTTEIPVSTSLRKRRLPTVIRSETPASPLPVAAALTMSESLYNHFRPLDKEVPEDHLLPFLDFGKKLIPVNAKTTSPVAGSSSTSSTNSIEATGTSPRTPPQRQYNLLNTTPQKVLSSNTRTAHFPREDEIHEDMDVSVVKSVVEKNKVSRSRGNTLQFLRNLGGLYRKHGTVTSEIVANPSTTSITPASSTENTLRAEEATKNNSDLDDSSRMKFGSVNNVSTPRSSTEYPSTSQGTHRNSHLGSHYATEASNTSVNDHSTGVTNLSTHAAETERRGNNNQSSQNSDISEQLALFSTSQSRVPTQLSASSSHVEATVSTPFVRGRPSTTAKSAYSFTFPNRRPPSIHLHFNRNSNIVSKSSTPSYNTSKSENVSLYTERKTPEKGVNLTNTFFTSGSSEKSALARTSSIPLRMLSSSPNMYTGRKEFVNDSTIEYENKVNLSELMNAGKKLVVNPKERYAQTELPTKTNGSLFEDTVNNSGSNISSETSVESVTAKLITSTTLQYSQTNITVPTEAPPITSSVQSPTTKILSTAVVTSVSVKGAWPVMVTDTPPLEPTLVSPESYRSQNTKNESLEHVLGPPERNDTNQTQTNIKGPATPQTHHLTISTNGSISRQFPRNIAATNTSSNSNSSSTDLHKEVNDAPKNPEFTTDMKAITSNSRKSITHIVNEYGENNTMAYSVNKSMISQTLESSTSRPTTEEKAVSVASNKKSNVSVTETPATSTDSPLAGSHDSGVTYPPSSSVFVSKSVTRNPVPHLSRSSTDMPSSLPETTRTKDVTHTLPEYGTREGHIQDTHVTSSQVTMKSLAPDSEFDFPLLKLYNSSTVWSVPARGATKTSNESRKSAIEHPATGNGSTEVTNHMKTTNNVTETSTRKISIVDDVTKAAKGVNTTSDIYEGESRNETTGKYRKEEMRPSKDADVPNNTSASSSGVGNVFSSNASVVSPRPGESVETTQSATIALYVLAALGIVPLTVGVALAARYCVQRRRKVSYIPRRT
jgi:hypothetical protein